MTDVTNKDKAMMEIEEQFKKLVVLMKGAPHSPGNPLKISSLKETELSQCQDQLKVAPESDLDNLDENKKRRLVIGIAINSVLPPTMRNYVSGKLGLLSETFKLNRHTDIQIYPFHPKSYLTTHQTYEVIDGNKDLGLGQQGQFICLVEDAVGRYRLFLIPHIAHNISFDSCDLPSLLEIIIRKCPAAIQIFVKRVIEEVQNRWAHCDVKEWNDYKYNTCIMLILELIGSILHQVNRKNTIVLLQKLNSNPNGNNTLLEKWCLKRLQTTHQYMRLVDCLSENMKMDEILVEDCDKLKFSGFKKHVHWTSKNELERLSTEDDILSVDVSLSRSLQSVIFEEIENAVEQFYLKGKFTQMIGKHNFICRKEFFHPEYDISFYCEDILVCLNMGKRFFILALAEAEKVRKTRLKLPKLSKNLICGSDTEDLLWIFTSMEIKSFEIFKKKFSSSCIVPKHVLKEQEKFIFCQMCMDEDKFICSEYIMSFHNNFLHTSVPDNIQESTHCNNMSRYLLAYPMKTESLYHLRIALEHIHRILIEDYNLSQEEFLITLPNQNRAIDHTFIPEPITLECLDSFIRSDIIKSTKMDICILALVKVLDLNFFGHERDIYRGMVEFYNESVVTTLNYEATLLRLCSDYFFETNFQKLCACFQVCTSVSVQALLQLGTSYKNLPQGSHNQIETIVGNTCTKNLYLSTIYSLFTLMTYTVNEGSIFTANEEPKKINMCSVTLEPIVKDFKCYSTEYSVKAETEGKSNQDIDLSHNEIKKFLYNIINYNWQPRRDEISVYPASTPLDMSNELIRVGSLANFPDNNHPSLIRVAQAGFYSEGKGRELKCYSCGQKYDQWLCNSNPLEIHQRISPNCDFLKTLHPPSSQSMNFFMRQNSQPSPAEVDSSYRVANSHVGSSSRNDSQPRTEPPQTHFYEADCRNPSSADSTSFSILTSSSGRPVNIMSNSNPGSVSYDSGLPSSVGKSGFERPQHGSSLTSQSNSGAGNGYASNSSASSSGYGSGSQGFASSNSSGSSGFRSADSGFSSGSSTSGAAKPPNLPTHTQLPTLDEIPQENVQSNIPKEKYPEYKEVAKRRESYKTWPEKLQFLHPLDLAECGFFYSKFGDCVRCFHCGIGLRNWETDDNPWVEHARWSRKCYYLRQKKGQEFIDQVLTILGLQTDSEIEMQAAGITPPQSEPAKSLVKDPIKHQAAQYIITEQIFGEISERTMKKAMNQLLQQHEWEDITNERLIDYLLENREKIESGETKTNHANMSESAEAKSPTSNITEDNVATGSADPEKLQKENEELKDLYTCKICLDEKVGITFVPCGHLVTCRNCSPKIKRCPLCRTFIRGTIKTTI